MQKSGKDVLIVDDDESIRMMIRSVLTRRGLTCDMAADGVYAVEHLAATRYAVVLLDLMMPRLDGFGVLRKMAADRECPMVFVMTASLERDRLLESGHCVQVVIRKPFDIQQLSEIVGDCVTETAQRPITRSRAEERLEQR